jgi:hypothetical protein
MQPLIVEATLVLLVSAAFVFAFQTFIQAKRGFRKGNSFSTLLLVVIIGWIGTEVVSDATGTSLGDVGRWTHLSVMILLAGAITLQFKRAKAP